MDNTLPRHVGIIMDGNGRWAQNHGAVRAVGHRSGTENVRTAISYASEKKIEVLTLYAFSTENWKRPANEVNAIMNLIIEYLRRETPEMKANNVVLGFIGDLSRIPAASLAAIDYSVKEMQNNTGLKVNIALNYGGRAEITRAARELARQACLGKIKPEDITEEMLGANLYTAGQPDPDLIIRTGAEKRISNFLTWQSAYSELYFTDVLWPDFSEEEFQKALDFFANRIRRYGGL